MLPTARRRGRLLVTMLSLMGLVVLAACGGSDDSPAPEASSAPADGPAAGAESAQAALEQQRTVIDVRTPEEFSTGHVDAAELIDAQDPSFDDQIAELAVDDEYVVYCRTGNRSAAAVEKMRALGLDALDGGGLPDMTGAGWTLAD